MAITTSNLDIKLRRVDRVYQAQEKVQGTVVVSAKAGWSHQGITMKASGCVKLQVSARNSGLFDTFYNSVRPLVLLDEDIEICPSGRLPEGVTEIPFEFTLNPLPGKRLFETYHGVYVNVSYNLAVHCTRGILSRHLDNEIEFVVEVPTRGAVDPLPVNFTVTPASLENVRQDALGKVPRFRVSGLLSRSNCPINQPFTGEVNVELAEHSIKSLGLQLVRVETVSYSEGHAREATEIQNIQIGDGDVTRNLIIPIYMIFPRLFTCPTMLTENFKIEFEVNVVIVFTDGYVVTENFPISLHRAEEGMLS